MRVTPSLILLWTVVGCGSSSGPDSNVEVFKTPEQVRAERQAKLAAEWRRTAATIARAERRDVAITEADGLSILAAAGGAKRAIDLSDLKDRLNEAGANPTEILRPRIQRELAQFDQDRLVAMGFAAVRSRIEPYLLAADEVAAMARGIGEPTLPVLRSPLAGLYWTVVARFADADYLVPLSPRVLEAWKTAPADVQAQAMANLKAGVDERIIQSIPYGVQGRMGSLRPKVNPAVVLLPEFLRMVRKAWGTDDPLVMMLATREDVRFFGRSEGGLMAVLPKVWSMQLVQTPMPLLRRLAVLSDEGLTPLVMPTTTTAPMTRPATKPATRIWIVH